MIPPIGIMWNLSGIVSNISTRCLSAVGRILLDIIIIIRFDKAQVQLLQGYIADWIG